jgi:hypothetical protein
MAEPLYKLLKKRTKFKWEHKQEIAIEGLKEIFKSPPVLRHIEHNSNRLVIVSVDTNSIAIGWAVGQDDADGRRFVVRFGARILSKQKRAYPQVQKELLGALTALKAERNYSIGAKKMLELDCF